MSAASGSPAAKWNDTRVLIFTEYDDTKRYLQQQLAAAIAATGPRRRPHRHLPRPHAARRNARRSSRPSTPTRPSIPLRILIATDAAREGLNLQAHCWNLFHFDVPWNPSRMEQRNGRIDRKLQPKHRGLLPLLRLPAAARGSHPCRRWSARRRRSRRNWAACPRSSTPGWRRRSAQGIRRRDIDRLELEIDSADLDSETPSNGRRRTGSRPRTPGRSCANRSTGCATCSRSPQKSIGLDEGHFRSAISCALELVGRRHFAATAASSRRGSPVLHGLPSRRSTSGTAPIPSWADTMDTLADAPQARPEALGMAPDVADPSRRLRGSGHAGRRRRPPAPGASRRAAAARPLHRPGVRPPRPVARLPGPDDRRHPARHPARPALPLRPRRRPAARGIDPGHRPLDRPDDSERPRHSLRPRRRNTNPQPAGRVSAASRRSEAITEIVRQQLQAAAPRDVQELLPHLQTRGEEYAADAEKKLPERGEAEAKAMREILETQKKHIAATVERQTENGRPAASARLRRRRGRTAAARSQQAPLGQAARSCSTASCRPSRTASARSTR